MFSERIKPGPKPQDFGIAQQKHDELNPTHLKNRLEMRKIVSRLSWFVYLSISFAKPIILYLNLFFAKAV